MQGGPEAFTLDVITEEVPEKVESLCAWEDDSLLVGLSDGSLAIYEPEYDAKNGPWRLSKHRKGIGRRAISQLSVCSAPTGVVSLSDDGVQLHRLPELDLQCTVTGSKYATRFCWNDSKKMLAVAIKRKLIFHKLDGSQFVELSAINVPDVVQTMAWSGEDVCLGVRRYYYLANPDSGELKELSSVGKLMKPSITPLPGREILLARENVGMFIGFDGTPTRKPSSAITWSEPPLAVVVSKPYVLALLTNCIEVRNLSPTARQGVVQMLIAEDIRIAAPTAASDGAAYVASRLKKEVCRLSPIPMTTQVASLVEMREFQDALELCNLLPDEERTEMEDILRVRYGIHLFFSGEYNDGLQQFSMRSKRSPLLLLKLFPSLVPEEMMQKFSLPVPEEYFEGYEELEGDEFEFAVSCLLPYLLSHRNRLASRKMEDEEMDRALEVNLSKIDENQAMEGDEDDDYEPSRTAAGLAPSKMISRVLRSRLSTLVDTAVLNAMLVGQDTGALLQFVQQPNFVDIREGEVALTQAGRYAELAALYQSHGLHDQGLSTIQKMALEPESFEIPPAGTATSLVGKTGVWFAVRYLSKLTEKDASVIQKHAGWVLKLDPEAALEVFISSEKRLPPSVVLPILNNHAREYSAIYLEAMLENGDASPEEFHGPLVNIHLKQAVGNEEKLGPLHLIKKKQEQEGVRTLDRLSSLRESSKKLGDGGLPLFPAGDEEGPMSVKSEDSDAATKGAFDAMTPIESYDRLRELIMNSPHINPVSVLASIPSGKLLELRALLQERLGNPKSALQVYILQLDDLQLAEALCDRVYALKGKTQKTVSGFAPVDNGDVGDIYMTMLQIYIQPKEGDSGVRELSAKQWEKVAELLSRKLYRINIEGIFHLLPGHVDLSVMMPFLEGALRALAEQQRNAAVVRSLRTCENLEMKEQLIRCKQRMVMVSSERACWLCHKRIGSSVVVAYPNNNLAHYLCHRRETQN